MALQWMGLCVAAAFICALLRPQRPELATVIALAAGVAVVAMIIAQLKDQLPRLRALWDAFKGTDQDIRSAVLRGAGVALVSDFASQLCRDAGEGTLADRVTLIARVSILALCAPLVVGLLESFSAFLP